MQTQDSNILLQDLPDNSPKLSREIEGRILAAAFAALPDAAYLFGSDRRLIKANVAAALQGEQLPGAACCEMFWHVEGAEGCVVDRAGLRRVQRDLFCAWSWGCVR